MAFVFGSPLQGGLLLYYAKGKLSDLIGVGIPFIHVCEAGETLELRERPKKFIDMREKENKGCSENGKYDGCDICYKLVTLLYQN